MSTETLGLVPRDWMDMVGPLAHGQESLYFGQLKFSETEERLKIIEEINKTKSEKQSRWSKRTHKQKYLVRIWRNRLGIRKGFWRSIFCCHKCVIVEA